MGKIWDDKIKDCQRIFKSILQLTRGLTWVLKKVYKWVLSNFDIVGVISWTKTDMWRVQKWFVCQVGETDLTSPVTVTDLTSNMMFLQLSALNQPYLVWSLPCHLTTELLDISSRTELDSSSASTCSSSWKLKKLFQQFKWFMKIICFLHTTAIFSESIQFVIGYKIFRIVLKNSEIIVTMSQRNTDIDIFEMTSIYFKLCQLAG